MWPLILILVASAVYCEEEKVFRVAGTDSYLEAYKNSRGESASGLLDDAVKKTDRQYVENSGYAYPNPQYGPPSGPDYNYGPPRPQYSPSNPGPAFGPLRPSYGPPNVASAYGPPNPPPVYGPPNPPPVYGPPAPPPPPAYGPPSSVQVFYGVPHAMLSFWDKLKYKLDLLTIGKILLKLIIFKKIVSFIAIICLLLFIPALKHKVKGDNDNYVAEDEDDMMRKFGETKYDKKLNNITSYVLEAIENFSKIEGSRSNCDSTYCKIQKNLKKLNKQVSYKRLAKLYAKELQR